MRAIALARGLAPRLFAWREKTGGRDQKIFDKRSFPAYNKIKLIFVDYAVIHKWKVKGTQFPSGVWGGAPTQPRKGGNMKLGVIDVGGGFRDIYGAGVFDWCLDHDVHFDYCIGISAGSANLASFLAKQRGRNYTFYMDYVFRKEYASLDNWLRTRNYVDLDYVFTTLSGSKGENPIDYEALAHNPAEFYVGACDARTGQSVYFSKSCLKKDQYDIFKGSCALPLFCKPYVVDGIPCLDGGISDPVPVLKAFEDGCDKVVLILTRPVDQKREQKKDVMPARLLAKAYPKAAERLLDRYRAYNDGVEIAKEYQKLGKLLIVAPDDICGLSTLSKSHEKLQMMYDKGMRDAEKIGEFLKA